MPKPRKAKIAKDRSLPPPMYSDGGNRYVGKDRENSQILCMLCKVYGCACVKPSRTPLELFEALTKRIHYGEIGLRLGYRGEAEQEALRDAVGKWKARLEKVRDSLARGLDKVCPVVQMEGVNG